MDKKSKKFRNEIKEQLKQMNKNIKKSSENWQQTYALSKEAKEARTTKILTGDELDREVEREMEGELYL